MVQVVAYLLMVTDIGKEHEILNQLSRIKGVTEARTVYGEFDVIARVDADDMRTLDGAVTQIRKIGNVIRTVTLISS